MLEKIKELLGEELSKQVEEKLGKVELAVFNDGSVVPADKYDTLKSEYKAIESKYQTDVADFTTKLNTAVEGTKDYDVLKQSLDTLKAENQKTIDKYQSDLLNTKLDSAIDVALLKANVSEQNIPLLKPQINRENLKLENDSIIGLTDEIGRLQTTWQPLFGKIEKTGTQPATTTTTQPIGKKAQLIEKYNEAEKSKNARAMMSYQAQLSQLKE